MVEKDLDIAEYTDPAHDPMIPHTIILEPGLIIYKVYNGYWFFGRPTLEDLRQDLRAVLQKCRPDWDITTPELKAAWQQGRKESFYPYGKSYVQTLGSRINTLARMRDRGRNVLQAPVSDASKKLRVGVAIIGVRTCGKIAVEHFRERWTRAPAPALSSAAYPAAFHR